jgi:hypothetical protein
MLFSSFDTALRRSSPRYDRREVSLLSIERKGAEDQLEDSVRKILLALPKRPNHGGWGQIMGESKTLRAYPLVREEQIKCLPQLTCADKEGNCYLVNVEQPCRRHWSHGGRSSTASASAHPMTFLVLLKESPQVEH